MLHMNTGADKTKGMPVVSATSELSDEERKALKGLADVLKDFISLRPNMPMHQVVVMIQVALDEGRSLKHYSDTLEYPTATVSRAFLDNGQKMRNGEEGLGLLEARQSARSLREHETHLTAKGRKLLRDAAKKLAGKR